MKRAIPLILAVVLLTAALASCAGNPTANTLNANIRFTSSDALDATAWLTDRLGDKLTDSVVIGTDADEYALDVSTLESDGYFIRSLGNEVALFARTTDGLDRAVRKYAKMVEAGAVADVTYHEGARIKKLTIAGRDISEYTVFVEDENYMILHSAELVSRLKSACGVELNVSTEAPAAPYIALRYVHDESLGNVGYRWNVTADGLTIECSDKYKPQSALCAIRRFLQTRLDWFGLTYGFDDLTPCDLCGIDVGESGGEIPSFEYMSCAMGDYVRFEHVTNRPLCCGPVLMTGHGLTFYHLGDGYVNEYSQPCYLNEVFYDTVYNNTIRFIEDKIDAGQTPGMEDFPLIPLGQPDNARWCRCKKCLMMLSEEGSYSAHILTWVNRLSDDVEQDYPGLMYGIFAYNGTNTLPKTIRPNDKILVTYCFDMNCSAHPLDASMCGKEIPRKQVYHGVPEESRANAVMCADYLDWIAVTKKVVAYYYGLPDGLQTMTFVHTVWDDMHFLGDSGAAGVYWESETMEYDTGRVADWLAMELLWDMDMSREHYDEIYDRVLRVMYGEDAAPFMREYIDLCGVILENGPCMHCFGLYEKFSSSINIDLWEKYFDVLFELTERAVLLADCSRQQRLVDCISCECIYKGAISSYFDAYDAYDDERVAELCRRYSIIGERMAKYGIDMETNFCLWLNDEFKTYASDLEVEAWSATDAGALIDRYPTRAMPERVAAILAERGE